MAEVRAVLAVPHLGTGGPERALMRIAPAFDPATVQPTFLVYGDDGHSARSQIPGIDVVSAGSDRSRYPIRAVSRALRELDPDVVLATLRMLPTVLAGRRLGQHAYPVVARPANNPLLNTASLRSQSLVRHRIAAGGERRLLRGADSIIAQSSSMHDAIAEWLGPAHPPIHTVPNAIAADLLDASRMDASDAGAPWPSEATPRIVSVGRLTHQKGFDRLLPALAVLRASHPSVHLTILGDGPDRAELERTIAQLDLGSSVTLTGAVEDPFPCLVGADLFVLPSRYEGLSNALLEAQALGVPAVAMGGPAAGADIVDEGSGIVVTDPDMLADAMVRALAQRWDRDHIRRRVTTAFHPRAIADRYAAVLRDASLGA